jgi:hypothetical protein
LGLSLIAMIGGVLLPFTHFGSTVFAFKMPTLEHMYIIFTITAGYFIASEAIKLLYYRFSNTKK